MEKSSTSSYEYKKGQRGQEARIPGTPPGYDPENTPPDPNAPLWKKIARIIMDAIRAANP